MRSKESLIQAELSKDRGKEFKALYEKLHKGDLNLSDIKNSNIKPWLKKYLTKELENINKCKEENINQEEARKNAEHIADMMRKKTERKGSLEYSVYRFNGPSISIVSTAFTREIKPGDMVLYVNENTIRINQGTVKLTNIQEVLNRAEFIGTMDIMEFNRLIQKSFSEGEHKFEHAIDKVNQRIFKYIGSIGK